MYRMAVVGESWTVLGFAGLGVSVYPVKTEEEARNVLKSIEKNYAVIFVTETFYGGLEERLEGKFPIISLIPNNKERKNLGQKVMREVIRKAVGFEI